MDHLVGKRLDGRYELREIIGVGGMAVVYKAYDSIDDRIVAVKILKEEFVRNDEFRRRFKNESKAIAVLSHPNIVKVYDVSFGDQLQYIVMEYINGIPLKRYIERRGVLSYSDAVHFTIQILRALQHAHEKGIIHRDIKPQNIMLLQDGTIKVADFGIARFSASQQRTMTDQAIGSVHYISPEQARGDFTDGKADIYSVGVMLYEMITGRVPFEADSPVSVAIMQLQSDPVSPRSLNPLVPLGLEQITLRAMQKNPQMRYRSAAEMLLDLEDFQRNPEMTFSYDYFVDDSPTKYVTGSKAGSGAVTGEVLRLPEEEEPEEEPAKAPVIPILAGVLAAFLIVIGVVGVLIWKFIINPTGVAELEMPNLVGLNYYEVKSGEEYAKYKFNFDVVWEYSDKFEKDIIMTQRTKKGSKIKPGAKVLITVSQGPELVEVPRTSGLSQDEAKNILESLGFVTRIAQKKHDTVVVGYVIETNPLEGSKINKGDEIIIFVSTGPESVPVKVPDVVNLTLERAKKDLQYQGLVVKVEEEPSEKPKDVVLRQSPEGGKTVERGDTVTLYVSNGERPVKTYKANIPIDLPTEYKSKSIYVKAVVNNTAVFTTVAPVMLGEERSVDVFFDTTLEEAKVNIYFMLTASNASAEYKYMDFVYDFKNAEMIYGSENYYTLDPNIFPKKGESSDTSDVSSTNSFIMGY